LVEIVAHGVDLSSLATQSSDTDWEQTGKKLFATGNYLQAMHCFEKAGQPGKVAVSHAYHLRSQARKMIVTSLKQEESQWHAYESAAKGFIKCAKAATIDQLDYYRIAGECFSQARQPKRAAKAFLLAKEYTPALQQYRKAGLFDDAVDVLCKHRARIDDVVAEEFTDIARLYYLKSETTSRVSVYIMRFHLFVCSFSNSQIDRLFKSSNEQLQFAEEYGLDAVQTALLLDMGRPADAAQVHLDEGVQI
jgi:tetratricopeptide (TPR) repeat protein